MTAIDLPETVAGTIIGRVKAKVGPLLLPKHSYPYVKGLYPYAVSYSSS